MINNLLVHIVLQGAYALHPQLSWLLENHNLL